MLIPLYLHRANDINSLIRAAKLDIGVEVDVRAGAGFAVVSHDPAPGGSAMSLETYLNHWRSANVPLILNVKEQGMIPLLERSNVLRASKEHVFLSDVFVPDALLAEELGYRTLARKSKYESTFGPFYGTYLDFVENESDFLVPPGSKSFLVSPELHQKRKEEEQYRKACGSLKAFSEYPHIDPKTLLTDQFMYYVKKVGGLEGIITDYPEWWIDACFCCKKGYHSGADESIDDCTCDHP